jgi:hypothetical protein
MTVVGSSKERPWLVDDRAGPDEARNPLDITIADSLVERQALGHEAASRLGAVERGADVSETASLGETGGGVPALLGSAAVEPDRSAAGDKVKDHGDPAMLNRIVERRVAVQGRLEGEKRAVAEEEVDNRDVP